MGTVASLRAPESAPAAAIEAVFDALERRFSLYLPQSEASRIARGELALPAASVAMREAYAEALAWRTATDGAFTPHRPDGVVDLSGTIKAQAIRAAGRLLDSAGCTDWLLAVGGDVLGRGGAGGGPWSVGIVDPADRTGLLCAVPLSAELRAVATSGTAERGEHVWRRPTEPCAATFRQVSVVAPDILTADVLATAVLAGGRPSLDSALERYDIDVLACTTEGGLVVSDRLRGIVSVV
ncbi:FAD:protein FMN transferase [Rathayibacter sp. VKM Ac-2759]|nr:FAD:protein FMN transferase [Rathayibacter sp. VKM Ac-2759]